MAFSFQVRSSVGRWVPILASACFLLGAALATFSNSRLREDGYPYPTVGTAGANESGSTTSGGVPARPPPIPWTGAGGPVIGGPGGWGDGMGEDATDPLYATNLVFWMPFDGDDPVDPINGLELQVLTTLNGSNYLPYTSWVTNMEATARMRSRIISNQLYTAHSTLAAQALETAAPGIAGFQVPLAGTTMEKQFSAFSVGMWVHTPPRHHTSNYGGSILSIGRAVDGDTTYNQNVDRLFNITIDSNDDAGSIRLGLLNNTPTTLGVWEMYDPSWPGESNTWTFIAVSVDAQQTEFTFTVNHDTRLMIWQPWMGSVSNAFTTTFNAWTAGTTNELDTTTGSPFLNLGGGPRIFFSNGASADDYAMTDTYPVFMDNVRFYDAWLTSNTWFEIIQGDIDQQAIDTNYFPYANIPNQDTLLWHWDFNEPNPLDSRGLYAGTLNLYNSSVVTNGVLVVDAEPEGAYLRGADSSYDFENFIGDPYLGLTMMAWVNIGDPQNPDSWEAILTIGDTTSSQDAFGLWNVSGDLAGMLERVNFAFEYTTSTANLVHDQWRHVVWEYKIGIQDTDLTPLKDYYSKLWIDGTNVTENVLSAASVFSPRWKQLQDISIGFGYSTNDLYSGGSSFFGEIDDVRIYSNVGWTTNEIEAVMAEDPH